MKRAHVLILFLFFWGYSFAQDSLNFTKLSRWTSSNAVAYNDCWGYTDGAGREYAILGSNWGTHFIDITNPTTPIECASIIGLSSATNVIWRDFKTFGQYAYGVCDGYGASSLQIFDLSGLPGTVTKVYDYDSLSTNAHNIFIEGDRIYLPGNRRGGNYYQLDIISIANPTNPTLLNTMGSSWFGNCGTCIHDIFVKNDTAYCSAGTSGLYIYDLVDPMNPILISSITSYSEQGYNHASWVDEDNRVMVMADETHGSGVKTFDVSDITNPVETDVFRTYAGAIPHNPFVRGTEAYISYYHDGMQVFDLSDPQNVTQKAFYDTYPDNAVNNHSGYDGDWGVYPFFQSRNIIASDITYGLFVLGKINDVNSLANDMTLCIGDSLVIPYSIKGTFNGGNNFILEISDSNGTFKSPTTIDTKASTSAGTFITALPGNLALNKEYKARIRSTNPAVIEGEFVRFTIKTNTNITIDTTICYGDTFNFSSLSFDTAGVYSGTITSGGACDTNYNITIQNGYEAVLYFDTICSGDSVSLGGSVYDSTGNYTGFLNNINGCDTFFTLDLIVNQFPQPNIIDSNGTLYVSPIGYNYQWYFNGTLLPSGINQTYNPTQYGTYDVIVSDSMCSKSASYTLVPDGIIFLKDQIHIYPNPSKGWVNIENIENQNLRIEVLNVLGSKVKEVYTNSSTKLHLESGLFFIRVSSENGIFVESVRVD